MKTERVFGAKKAKFEAAIATHEQSGLLTCTSNRSLAQPL
jgi:hypothetical protein